MIPRKDSDNEQLLLHLRAAAAAAAAGVFHMPDNTPVVFVSTITCNDNCVLLKTSSKKSSSLIAHMIAMSKVS
jgi:hypothetical protein